MSEATCICPHNFSGTKDRHYINCPASDQFEAYKRMTPAQTSAETVEAGRCLDDVVPLSVGSAWDDETRRQVIRAMIAFRQPDAITTLTRERDEWRERAGEMQERCARVADQYVRDCDRCLEANLSNEAYAYRNIAAAIRRLDQPVSDDGRGLC